jgi:Fe-S-cluster containining protein
VPRHELPDCQDCALCCFSSDERFAELENTDFARLTLDEQVRLTVFRDGRCHMRVEEGHCAALVRRDGRWACSVYERRPQVCRDFERGADACRYELDEARGP